MNQKSLSHITILKSREPISIASSRITTDFIIELEALIDRGTWRNRREFFYQTLAFCLSLPNLWRFPKEALIGGQGITFYLMINGILNVSSCLILLSDILAAFVWLYIIFMITIGSCLLFFEVALGQYSNKGFSKVFAMCPIFEGISYSMAFYCAIVLTYYNMLNVYSFIYIFASLNQTVEYASCDPFPKELCVEGTTNQTLSPEYVYFYNRIVYYSSNNFNETFNFYQPNWRNVGVLFFLWVLVCIVILRGIRTLKWPAMLYCPLPYIVLTFTLITSLTLEGSGMGLKAMFLLNPKDLLNASIWRRAFEQIVVSLGLGMGPLITLGSYSDFQSPADRDCLILCIFTLIGSLLSGSVIFTSAGVLAYERNQTMATVLKQNGRYPSDLSVHVVFSQLFSRMPFGVSQFASFAIFLTFLLGGWYSLITYTETFIVSCYTFFPPTYKHKVYTNLGLCICCYVFGASMASGVGYSILMALDRFLVAIGLVVIILCELCAVIYIYGIVDFADDVDFMLGFYPNMYYQSVWIFTPFILLFLFIYFLYFCVTERMMMIEKLTVALVGTTIILPILIVGFFNVYNSYKMGSIRQVLAPREVILLDEDEYISRHGSGHGDRGSTKRYKRSSDTKLTGVPDSAGPSRPKGSVFPKND